MFPLMMPMLIGGGLGALTSKNPLKGALLGAGAGALGGTMAPGLLGGMGTAAGTAGPVTGMATGAIETGLPAFNPLTGGYVNQLADTGAGMKGLLDTIKPIGQAASTASQLGLLGGNDQPIIPSPTMQTQTGGSQVLGQLAQTPDVVAQGIEKRKARRGLV